MFAVVADQGKKRVLLLCLPRLIKLNAALITCYFRRSCLVLGEAAEDVRYNEAAFATAERDVRVRRKSNMEVFPADMLSTAMHSRKGDRSRGLEAAEPFDFRPRLRPQAD